MFKNYKWKSILSSVLILVPTIAGLFLWEQLPDTMITHWGADGVADGFGNKTIAVFMLPFEMLVLHWICLFFTFRDPNNKNNNQKALGLVFWIMPAISLIVCSTLYRVALGQQIQVDRMVPAVIGVLFVVLGNYMPKISRNRTFGIKVVWALHNEENWNKTHRFGGKLWVVGGLFMLCSLFLPEDLTVLSMVYTLVILAVAPILYSYLLHRKNQNNEAYRQQQIPITPLFRRGAGLSLLSVVVIVAGIAILMFTGDIDIRYEQDSFSIEASYWSDLSVDYDRIQQIEYRDTREAGSRTSGYGSPRLSMGTFRNNEFGQYTLYAYTDCDACVVLRQGEHTLVINGKNAAETKAIYEELKSRVPQS